MRQASPPPWDPRLAGPHCDCELRKDTDAGYTAKTLTKIQAVEIRTKPTDLETRLAADRNELASIQTTLAALKATLSTETICVESGSSSHTENDFHQLHYTRLTGRQTRVFSIEATRKLNDPVRIRLHVIDIHGTDNNAPDKFTTMSYAWGKTKADGSHLTDTIVCNGLYSLRVTATLHQALKQIRSVSNESCLNFRDSVFGTHKFPSLLWVDAICINQQDVEDRTHQVRLMAEIYSKAAAMIIWLGEDDSYECRVMQSDKVWKRMVVCRQDWHLEYGWTDRHLSILLKRSWFSRLWILQEYLLTLNKPRVILLGNKAFSAQRFEDVVRRHRVTEVSMYVDPRIGESRDLLHHLYHYHALQCADPHDRVYALESLSGIQSERQGDINYETLVEDLFLATTTSLVSSCESEWDVIRLLTCATASSKKSKSARDGPNRIPSWVPDWRNEFSFGSAEHERAVDKFMHWKIYRSGRGPPDLRPWSPPASMERPLRFKPIVQGSELIVMVNVIGNRRGRRTKGQMLIAVTLGSWSGPMFVLSTSVEDVAHDGEQRYRLEYCLPHFSLFHGDKVEMRIK